MSDVAVHPVGIMTCFDQEMQEQGHTDYQHGVHSITQTGGQGN